MDTPDRAADLAVDAHKIVHGQPAPALHVAHHGGCQQQGAHELAGQRRTRAPPLPAMASQALSVLAAASRPGMHQVSRSPHPASSPVLGACP